MDTTHDDIFIDRMIDALRDHTDPVIPLDASSASSGDRIWRMTTVPAYFEHVFATEGGNTDAELRIRIKRALEQGQIPRVLFLILVLAQLPEYRLPDRDRRPWARVLRNT